MLANGNASDYNNYKEYVGRIQGLEQAKYLIIDMTKNTYEEDDLK